MKLKDIELEDYIIILRYHNGEFYGIEKISKMNDDVHFKIGKPFCWSLPWKYVVRKTTPSEIFKAYMETENISIGMHVKFWNNGKSFIGNIIEIHFLDYENIFIGYSSGSTMTSSPQYTSLFSIQMADGTTFNAVAENIEREATPGEVFKAYMES